MFIMISAWQKTSLMDNMRVVSSLLERWQCPLQLPPAPVPGLLYRDYELFRSAQHCHLYRKQPYSFVLCMISPILEHLQSCMMRSNPSILVENARPKNIPH
jgi:hypothetical protein